MFGILILVVFEIVQVELIDKIPERLELLVGHWRIGVAPVL